MAIDTLPELVARASANTYRSSNAVPLEPLTRGLRQGINVGSPEL
jgi:hypothetical protein